LIEQLNMPLKLKYSLIKKLKLKIPWKKLTSQPIEATLEGLELKIYPQEEKDFSY